MHVSKFFPIWILIVLKKAFKCNICDASFPQKGNLNVHIESVHEEMKPFKYKICDASFSRKATLKKHIESVH